MCPQSVLPVWCEVVIAVLLGHAVYKHGKSIMTWSIIAVIAMYVTVAAGIGMGYPAKDGQILTGVAAWTTHYSSWAAAAGLGSKISAFVDGSANMISCIRIPTSLCVAVMGVSVASFAGTTLDTATRVQRYIISGLFSNLKFDFLTGKYAATFLAVATALVLAFATGAGDTGTYQPGPFAGDGKGSV